MLRLVAVVALIAAAVALPLGKELDEDWAAFKQIYNKQYSSEDALIRRLIWEQNIRFIRNHNLEADRGLHTYRVGENQYIDLTDEEFVSYMNGYKMVNRSSIASTFMSPTTLTDLPTSVDWRPKGYVTPIKNQLQCGSCWAFSATGSLEGQHFRKTGTLTSLSEQNLVDCSQSEGNHGCGGGLMDFAFQYIKVNDGIDTETSYPYKARNQRCTFKKADVGATDTGFTDIKQFSETDLQAAVATVGPISVAIDASRPSFRMYKSGVYSDPTCSSTRLDHGVLAVGYGSQDGKDYWIVKNSWGTTYGMEGYILMSRNKNNQCGIATAASYPLV